MSLDDRQAWLLALDLACESYGRLPAAARETLYDLIHEIMQLKEELVELALAAGSADICRACKGKCCLHGKYYVTLLDLIAYHINGIQAVAPVFDKAPFCPYGGAAGCFMPPGFRPMTCVIFNCELIEEKMETACKQRAAACEKELREAIFKAERIAGHGLGRPALLGCKI